MQTQIRPKGIMYQLLPQLIQTGVGIFILLIIWLVVKNLPMLEEISFPLKFTLTEVLEAIILTTIVIMLCSFGSRMNLRLSYLIKSFPQSGTIVKQLFYLISILLVYIAFRPLTIPYMADLDWIYHVFFLVIFLIYFGVFGYSVYSSMEDLARIITGNRSVNPSYSSNSHSQIKCNNCGQPLNPETKFCFACGSEVNSANNGVTGVTNESKPLCISCGMEIKPGAKFCTACGDSQV